MAQEVRTFTINVPKGGTALAPQVFPLTMPPRIVKNVELFFPKGNGGQLWIAMGFGGTHIIPMNAGQYITAEDDTLKWPLDNFPDSGAWQLFAYNSGNYAHMLQIRFLVNIPGEPEAATPNLTETLNIVGDGSGGGFGGGGGGGGGDFQAIVTNTTLSMPQGGEAATSVHISNAHGIGSNLVVTAVGLPVGITPDIRPTSDALTYVVRFVVSPQVASGTYTAAVQVSAPGLTRAAEVDITVTPSASLPAVNADGAIHHLPVSTRFRLTWTGYANTLYFIYSDAATLDGSIATDTQGRGSYNSQNTYVYSGYNQTWKICPINDVSSPLCLSAKILSP